MSHTKPWHESKIIDDIFGSFRRSAEMGTLRVVLFCAGSSGRVLQPLLAHNGIHPVCYCDNNSSIVGQTLHGLPIISFDELKKTHRESLILIASTAYQNFVKKQLLDNGFDEERVLTLDTSDTSFDARIRRERLAMFARNGEPGAVLNDLRDAEAKLTTAYGLFADEHSKDLFIRRLALIASGYEYNTYREFLKEFSQPILKFGYDDLERLEIGGSYFYFNNDVIQLNDDCVLVDAGAFVGDSVDEFVNACEKRNVRYKKVYCFEPDPGNYNALKKNTGKYDNVTCINRGLWSCETTLRFISSAQSEAYGARIQVSENIADAVIETASIDADLAFEEVNLIKMDIEGAEIEAIKGAAFTIRRHKPQLAISVYHNTTDLYEIPLLVHEICPSYRLYLRHFGNYFDDTMLLTSQ
jgi:FkbM family methyltransferase